MATYVSDCWQCPYFKDHKNIPSHKFGDHLAKCEKHDPHIPRLIVCPFNSLHRVRDLSFHVNFECSDLDCDASILEDPVQFWRVMNEKMRQARNLNKEVTFEWRKSLNFFLPLLEYDSETRNADIMEKTGKQQDVAQDAPSVHPSAICKAVTLSGRREHTKDSVIVSESEKGAKDDTSRVLNDCLEDEQASLWNWEALTLKKGTNLAKSDHFNDSPLQMRNGHKKLTKKRTKANGAESIDDLTGLEKQILGPEKSLAQEESEDDGDDHSSGYSSRPPSTLSFVSENEQLVQDGWPAPGTASLLRVLPGRGKRLDHISIDTLDPMDSHLANNVTKNAEEGEMKRHPYPIGSMEHDADLTAIRESLFSRESSEDLLSGADVS